MAFSRRSLLQSFSLGAGGVVLSPFLQRLQAADEGGNPPKRIVFVLQSNGFHPWAAQPKKLQRTEAGPSDVVDLSLEDYDLSEDMTPLQPHRWRTTIIQRMHGEHCRPFHSAQFGALQGSVCKRSISRPKPTAETIDARLARIHPATFPLVNLGVNNGFDVIEKYTRGGQYACSSAWGPDAPVAAQLDPRLAYKALFGEAAAKVDEGGRLLDAIGDDVKKVNSKLSAADREKFAAHLDAFESLDQRRQLFQKAGGQIVEPGNRPAHHQGFTSSLESKRLEAQFELAAAGLIAGLTNTVTIVSGACSTNGHFEGLGFDKAALHSIGHFKNRESPLPWKEVYVRLRQFHFKQIANLIEKLSQASDHNGSSLMENTLIVYTSDGAETHHSKGKEWPFVIIGDWGGKLRQGRFIEYPASGNKGSRVINSLYCTLLQAAGVEAESFNLPENFPGQRGPLPELKTA